jgi:hypothetical protein
MELDVNKTMHMVTKPPSTNFEIEDILRNDISKASGASRHSLSRAYQDYHTGGSAEENDDHAQSQSKSTSKQGRFSNPASKSSKAVVDRSSNDNSKQLSSRSRKSERKEQNAA